MITAAGGLALFLLGMSMMTDGLKTFAGAGLRQLLAQGTATPLRGVLSGVVVTALVQSSSAVTIATIGFVNAGMLTLRQALGVVFGTNVGTTMTGWLVSLVGFGWKIDNLALPLLTVGVVMRLAADQHRLRGFGDALAGFGLFFLALSLLQGAFADFAAAHGTALVSTGSGLAGLAAAVVAGILVTTLTQSSSAALAIILSAASSGLVDLPAAAAAVIGANIGTTSTAALAAIRATAAAKRLALGHIAFNLVTGAIALLLLPLVLAIVARLAAVLEIGSGAAPFLALFHTSFNVLGVLIMLPLARRLADRLERWFHTEDENLRTGQRGRSLRRAGADRGDAGGRGGGPLAPGPRGALPRRGRAPHAAHARVAGRAACAGRRGHAGRGPVGRRGRRWRRHWARHAGRGGRRALHGGGRRWRTLRVALRAGQVRPAHCDRAATRVGGRGG